MRLRILGLLCLLVIACASVSAQESDMKYAAAASSKFATMPGLPTCMQIAVQKGDPTKEAAVLLLRFAPGCTVPWHWHTAGENLMMVSGRAEAQMKDGKPVSMRMADYIYLPAKSIHEFKAKTAVTLFDAIEGAFDIHYVDQSGNEIPPDQALKSSSGGHMSKKPMDEKPK